MEETSSTNDGNDNAAAQTDGESSSDRPDDAVANSSLSRMKDTTAENREEGEDNDNANEDDEEAASKQLGVAMLDQHHLLQYKDSSQESRLVIEQHQQHRNILVTQHPSSTDVSTLTQSYLTETAQVLPEGGTGAPDLSMLGPNDALQQPALVPVVMQSADVAASTIPFATASPVFTPHEESLRARIAALEAGQLNPPVEERSGSHSSSNSSTNDNTQSGTPLPNESAKQKTVSSSSNAGKRSKYILLGLGAGVVILSLIIALVILTRKDEDTDIGSTPTITALTTLEDRVALIRQATLLPPVSAVIPSLEYTPLANISSAASVEELAMALVVEQAEDEVNLSEQSLLQRYVLTTLLLKRQPEAASSINTTDTPITLDWPWWNFQEDECEWPSVKCGLQGEVTELLFPCSLAAPCVPSPLRGTLPPDIGLLTSLANLQIENNTLTGTIPPSLGRLTNIVNLHLFDNAFTGTFPGAWFGPQLSDLKVLRVGGNALTGTFPTILAPSLMWISFFRNNLRGTLPNNLFEGGPRLSIEALITSENQLTGTIPDIFWSGEMIGLQHLFMNDNFFTGTLPDRGPTFQRLELRGNQLTGTMPAWTALTPGSDLTGNNFVDSGAVALINSTGSTTTPDDADGLD